MENFESGRDLYEKPNNKEARYHNEIPEYRELSRQTQDSLERARAQTLAEKIGTNLKREFEGRGISFNLDKFVKNFEERVSSVLSQSGIPEVAKQKFLQDVEKKMSNLMTITVDDINSLQTRRNIESFGIESWEVSKEFGDDEAKKQAYYLQKILEETLGKYVDGASTGLQYGFQERAQNEDGNYNKENYETFRKSIQELDTKYGIDTFSLLQKLGKDDRSIYEAMDFRQIQMYIFGQLKKLTKLNKSDERPIWSAINSKTLNTGLKNETTTLVTVNGTSEDIVDILQNYTELFKKFSGKEGDISRAREVATDTGVVSKARNMLGADQLESDFSYIEPSNIEEKIKDMKFADAVIMLTQLAQLAPIVGDIGGGLDGLYTAYSGMNVSGEKVGALERSLNTVFGILGVTVIGGWLGKALKAKQFGKIIETLKKIIPHLREKFNALSSQLPEPTKKQVASLLTAVNILGGEPAQAGVKLSGEASLVEKVRDIKKVFSPQEKLANASLEEAQRIQKAEEYLGVKLTDAQKEALLAAHNYGAEGEGAYSQGEKVVKGKKLMEGGLTREQAQILLDSALAGTPDKIAAGLKDMKGFNFRGISEEISQSIKSQISDFIRISKNLDVEENQTRLLAMISETSDISLRNLLISKETRNIRGEVEFSQEFLQSVEAMITYFKNNKGDHSVNIPSLESFQDLIKDGFLSADQFAPDFHTFLEEIRKGFSKKTEKITLRSEYLVSEVGLDTTRVPNFDKIMPPELIKAMNMLVEIYKQKGNAMTLADIPTDLRSTLEFFSKGGLYNFIETQRGGQFQVLTARLRPTEVISNMYAHLTNLQAESGVIQRGDFNERLNPILTFQQLVGTFSFLAGK